MESSSQAKAHFWGFVCCVSCVLFDVFCCGCPRAPSSMLEFCCGTCELDSIACALTFVSQTTLYPTLSLGVRGEITNNLQKCYCSHLRTRFHPLTKSRPNLKNRNTNLLFHWRLRLGSDSRSVLARGPCFFCVALAACLSTLTLGMCGEMFEQESQVKIITLL